MVNVFSFCLFGPPNPSYYPTPMLQNIELVRIHFSDWKVYVYVSPDVDATFIKHIQTLPNVVVRHTGVLGPINMIYRFLAIDEPDVDVMFVRDADSHIHWRDRWAVRDFLKRNYNFHVIRDHPEHNVQMPGGLWGMRKTNGIVIRDEYAKYIQRPLAEGRNGYDQDFLSDQLYRQILPLLFVHVSDLRLKKSNEAAAVFPFKWSDSLYCGRRDGPVFSDTQPSYIALSFLRR